MRLRLIALTLAGALALAGAARAQYVTQPAGSPETPEALGNGQHTGGNLGNEVGDRLSRYLMRVESLKQKVVRTKVQDGGRLTPEHEASLTRELQHLNRIYGVKQG